MLSFGSPPRVRHHQRCRQSHYQRRRTAARCQLPHARYRSESGTIMNRGTVSPTYAHILQDPTNHAYYLLEKHLASLRLFSGKAQPTDLGCFACNPLVR